MVSSLKGEFVGTHDLMSCSVPWCYAGASGPVSRDSGLYMPERWTLRKSPLRRSWGGQHGPLAWGACRPRAGNRNGPPQSLRLMALLASPQLPQRRARGQSAKPLFAWLFSLTCREAATKPPSGEWNSHNSERPRVFIPWEAQRSQGNRGVRWFLSFCPVPKHSVYWNQW